MDVVFDYDLHTEIGMVGQGHGQQGQQENVEWLSSECNDDSVHEDIKADDRSGKPESEKYQQDRGYTLRHKMPGAGFHSSIQNAAVIPPASNSTNHADAFAW